MTMSATPDDPTKFITVGGDQPFNIFWSPTQPDRIHMATGDPRFTDETGGRPGIRVVFSSNANSADYNPATFNRLARALAREGADAPAEVPVHRRHLRYRDGVIRELGSAEVPDDDLPDPGE